MPAARRLVICLLLLFGLAGCSLPGGTAAPTGTATTTGSTPAVGLTTATVPTTTTQQSATAATSTTPTRPPTPAPTPASSTASETASGATAATSSGPVTGPTPTFAPLPATATPSPDQSLTLLQETFTLLEEKFFRPIDSQQMLSLAWSAAEAQARKDGAKANVPAPTLTGDRATDLTAFSNAYLALVSGLSGNHADVAFGAAQAMTGSLHERHTYFLTPQEAQQFTDVTSGQNGLVGIGVSIEDVSGSFLVADVFPDGPAAKAGVQRGDEITAVDGHAVSGQTTQQLSSAISGAAGTPVNLTVKRPDGTKQDLTATRAQVFQPLLESWMLPNGACYLRLHNFPFADQLLPDGKTILEELDGDLQACEQAHTVGWVLDLRGNPGGADVARFASRFLASGVLSTSRDRLGATYEMAPEGQPFPIQRPLAVLVDRDSASSSEILASAVQDLHRGMVAGTHSAGVVNGTELVPLPLGAELGVAVEQVLRDTNGPPLDGTGVTPDVQVAAAPPTAEELAQGTDSQISAAADLVAKAAQATPPAATPSAEPSSLLPKAEIERLLGPLVPAPGDVPTTETSKRADQVLTTLNEYASEGPNLAQSHARAIRLGFQGAVLHRYGAVDAPDYTIAISLYAASAGAIADLERRYQPGEAQNPTEDVRVAPPAQLGDETIARVGTGPNSGSTDLSWRHGRVLFDVQHDGDPGDVPLQQMAEVARKVDALYQQHPIP